MKTAKSLFAAFLVAFMAGCASLPNIGVSAGSTFMTSGSCGYRGGTDMLGNRVGSDAWAAMRFVHNAKSPLRTRALPAVAEHADDRYWQANRIDIGLPVQNPDILEAQFYNMWVTRIRGCDVNFNVRLRDRDSTYSAERVEIQVVTETFGIREWPDGLRNSFTVYGMKERGSNYWRFETPQFDRYR